MVGVWAGGCLNKKMISKPLPKKSKQCATVPKSCQKASISTEKRAFSDLDNGDKNVGKKCRRKKSAGKTICSNKKTASQTLTDVFGLPPITAPVARFIPAVLKVAKCGYFVEYYAMNKGMLVRCRVKLNVIRKRFATLAEFKRYANSLCENINLHLANGWSPFAVAENRVLLDDVIARYLGEKEKELRPDTMRSYSSFCRMFSTWVRDNIGEIGIGEIERVDAVHYMEHIYNEKDLAARTCNNLLKMARAFFAFAVDRCYIAVNPFSDIKPKREGQKTRVLIPSEVRQRIINYLSERNRGMLLVCMLVHGALMRPKEIRMVQIKHVDLEKRYIVVPSENAKNHNQRYAPLNDDIVEEIKRLHIENINPNWYLIGFDWFPSNRRQPDSAARKMWTKLREDLKLPKEMQLYSLRDTGINGMLKAGIDPLTVMQAADHHDLSMTTRYANHADENLIARVCEKAPKF